MNKYDVLKKYFGHDGFRQGQEELINNILSGRDVLGIMPTGAGKSVCYQVPAMLMEGITIVISPLISLMKDQVSALVESGISAACINSSLSSEEYNDFFRKAYNGEYKLIYAAPERLDTAEFLDLAENVLISMVTIDEAHCVSQWGQNFRPSYLHIPQFIEKLSYRPIISAFTATATNEVRTDIVKMLDLTDPYTVVTGFDRKNLYFGVIKPANKYGKLTELLEKYRGKCGIVYCISRKNVEDVTQRLNDDGFSAARYHAGLSQEERLRNQDDFIYDRKQIMVATNAFGMGIDKSNVSFVIHYNMPQNIESYYQEAGRAGRDGEHAECILLYNGQDVRTNQFLINSTRDENTGLTDEEKEILWQRDMERLKFMTYYCTSVDCLRSYMLRYFGEKAPNRCGNCSCCLSEYDIVDITVDAQKIISCVYRVHQKGRDYGKKMIADILRGNKNERLMEIGFDKLSTYGIMADCTAKMLRDEIEWLILNDYLILTDDEFPVLRLSQRSAAAIRGEIKLEMQIPKKENKKKTAKASNISDGLFSELRSLRTELANKERVPAYIIFADAALRDMCAKKPVNINEFYEVSGVGTKKAEKYGDAFCELIARYIKEHPEEV